MATNPLYDSFLTFLSEAFRLLGWQRLLLAFLALLLIGALAVWVTSKLLCRGEKHLGASLTSPLMLALLALMVGAVYLVTMLRSLADPESSNGSGMLIACAALALGLVFIGVQGGFGTRWWKSAILTLVLVGSIAGAGSATAGLAFQGPGAQLDLLAHQVTGRTTEGPWLVQSPEATRRIQLRRAPAERLQIEKRQGELMRVYLDLQATRAKLDVNDAAAVAAFNEKAAAYSAESTSLKTRLAAAQALIVEQANLELRQALDSAK